MSHVCLCASSSGSHPLPSGPPPTERTSLSPSPFLIISFTYCTFFSLIIVSPFPPCVRACVCARGCYPDFIVGLAVVASSAFSLYDAHRSKSGGTAPLRFSSSLFISSYIYIYVCPLFSNSINSRPPHPLLIVPLTPLYLSLSVLVCICVYMRALLVKPSAPALMTSLSSLQASSPSTSAQTRTQPPSLYLFFVDFPPTSLFTASRIAYVCACVCGGVKGGELRALCCCFLSPLLLFCLAVVLVFSGSRIVCSSLDVCVCGREGWRTALHLC